MAKAAYLMCRPTFFGVAYEINPWMDMRRQPDRRRAVRQWEALRRLLTEEVGARVEVVRARPGLPDMTFTANAGLVRGRTFVPSRFRYRERAAEMPHFTAWFRRRGYRVLKLPADLHFEGAGDAMVMGDVLFASYYFRTDVQTHALLGEMLGVRVLSLELVNERFYHLDTCFVPVGPTTAVWYPRAFEAYSLKVIREHVPDLIEVTDEEAYRFGCNLVVADRQVVIPPACEGLHRDLADRGFTVHVLDLGEFAKAGGAARCLTLRLG